MPLAVLASRLAADGLPARPELRALLDDRVSRAENRASMLVILVILVLMAASRDTCALALRARIRSWRPS